MLLLDCLISVIYFVVYGNEINEIISVIIGIHNADLEENGNSKLKSVLRYAK